MTRSYISSHDSKPIHSPLNVRVVSLKAMMQLTCWRTPTPIVVRLTWWNEFTLRWCHNERAGVSNHQPHDCLLKRLFRRRSKVTSKLRVTALCAGNSLVTGEFPAQRASNAENVSIWWRHHVINLHQVKGSRRAKVFCLISSIYLSNTNANSRFPFGDFVVRVDDTYASCTYIR